ncbi:MAG: hypothetical protein NTX66_00390 [Candidatus Falkowbacteria bacterium]|nr:hypothetical protein [Candidatus Falkowbacteria bacterium]
MKNITEKDPTRKKKLKENLISLLIIIVLSLGAWFGVKAIVAKPGVATSATTGNVNSNRATSATLQLGATGTRAGGGGGFQGGGGFPGGGPGGD